ncbi:SusC/RagA family TonB-linked outer membrane protein [Gramella sp. MAR_2010_147]|uniref:SusC/RagA family TonB-linked outer membrane protein n=1 Tax=Gramella sp. MAR_2010_147 TaxID=1250205 RepID=UPI00087B0DC7|nr:SusC/RagA family TonB-linked outer membrane protein [Gramella sp. MAR_2010_147]SDS55630.1 TonB-linked outer membrane protein, SusC/RagA family [Gramella sp. MAR_2010_147]
MKAKFSSILTLLLAFVVQMTFAQEQTVSGTVTDQDGLPLPGVTVIIKGTSTGVQTDFDGNYNIEASQSDVLVFSFVGMKTAEYPVGSTNIVDVVLETDTAQLDEVVVTALGITREKKSLGYASQQLDGEEITKSRNSNALNALSGQVAGVQITNNSGQLGGSTRIVLRGVGSVTQGNKPLIVVDGIPLDNSNYNTESAQDGGGGYDFGDTGFDINPDDIASMNVLKGGAAAALYGNRANNGAIIITTKSGKKGKAEITVNSGVSFESINIIPQVQKLYGGGGGNALTIEQSGFEQATIEGTTYNIVDYGTDESWGPRYDANTEVLHWDAFDPEFPNQYLNPRPWVYPENDKEDFFNTGVSLNNGVALSLGSEKSTMRLSLNNTQSSGIVPQSQLDKTSLNFNGTSQLSDKLKIDAGINLTITDGYNRPAFGYSGNSVILQFFQFGQTQLDYERLKDYVLPDGTQRTWNRIAFDNPNPRYTDNPYWIINKNYSEDKRTRWFGNVGAQYNFTDDLYVTAKMYMDNYNFTTGTRIAEGSQAQSNYVENQRYFTELNYEAILHYDKSFMDDVLDLNTFVGANKRDTKFSRLAGNTRGGLAVPEIYNLGNSVDDPALLDYNEQKQIESVFGSASFGYDDMLYLTVTGRNDWSSTLPAENNSFFYPSINGSFVFSQVLDADWLSFGKLRGGYAEVGSDTDPYQLRNTFNNRSAFFGNIRYNQPDENKNPNLQPERKTTWEVGLEMGFFNNRFNFDVTYYDEVTEDLITPVQVDPSTGYRSTFANAGKLSNKGIEALVNLTPVQTEDFDWNVTWNFAKNENELLELLPGVNSLELASFPFKGVTLNAIVGEQYGIIRGTDFVYDDAGNKVVSAGGRYLATNTVQNLGSVLPDYNMGIRNSFRFKNIDFGFLIDMQKGGVYRSLTNIWGHYSGILESTAANNIREDGIVIDGVTGDVAFNNDGSYTVTNTAENTTAIPAQLWGVDHFFGPDAQNVFESDYWKLREVTLGYTLPKDWMGETGIESVRFSAFGRNLLVWGLDNDNFDPEVATGGSGNIQGSEGGSLPSTRTYGLNVEIKL